MGVLMNQKYHFILYIPSWESTDALQEALSYYEEMDVHITVLFDGTPPLSTSLKTVYNPTPKGLLASLHSIPVSAYTTIFRQGVRPTPQELNHAVEQSKDHDAVYVGDEYVDDGFIMMSPKGLRLFARTEPRLLSIGYGISAHALWKKHGLSCASISIAVHNTQHPDAHRAQICSNILRAWLSAKQIDFFAQRTPPSWYTPIKDKVSIVIPVWNNLQLVKQCVQSILTFTLHPFEIILVDNASHEPVAIWAEPMADKHANITYVRNTINHGFPQGCNIGITHATGEHILLLNSDTVVTPYWLSMLTGTS